MWPWEGHTCTATFLHAHVLVQGHRACLVSLIPKLMLSTSMPYYSHNYIKWEVSK